MANEESKGRVEPLVEAVREIIAAWYNDLTVEWFDRLRERVTANPVHSGDCTHECHSCEVCMLEGYDKDVAELLAILQRHVPQQASAPRDAAPQLGAEERNRVIEHAISYASSWVSRALSEEDANELATEMRRALAAQGKDGGNNG